MFGVHLQIISSKFLVIFLFAYCEARPQCNNGEQIGQTNIYNPQSGFPKPTQQSQPQSQQGVKYISGGGQPTVQASHTGRHNIQPTRQGSLPVYVNSDSERSKPTFKKNPEDGYSHHNHRSHHRDDPYPERTPTFFPTPLRIPVIGPEHSVFPMFGPNPHSAPVLVPIPFAEPAFHPMFAPVAPPPPIPVPFAGPAPIPVVGPAPIPIIGPAPFPAVGPVPGPLPVFGPPHPSPDQFPLPIREPATVLVPVFPQNMGPISESSPIDTRCGQDTSKQSSSGSYHQHGSYSGQFKTTSPCTQSRSYSCDGCSSSACPSSCIKFSRN